MRLGGSRFLIPEEEGGSLVNSGKSVPVPFSLAFIIVRLGASGATSLCTLGNSDRVCGRRGLKRGVKTFGDRFVNMDDDALIELGAGMDGVLGVLPSRGKLLALDGDGCTPEDEPIPFNVVEDVEFPKPGEYDGTDPVLVTRGMMEWIRLPLRTVNHFRNSLVIQETKDNQMNRRVVTDCLLDQQGLDRTRLNCYNNDNPFASSSLVLSVLPTCLSSLLPDRSMVPQSKFRVQRGDIRRGAVGDGMLQPLPLANDAVVVESMGHNGSLG